ncbi:hypothetical protein [Corallococcus aberystwythensis]|uniref:hypothetical protein n=1 Tax=Corallococcus aberystwythensis TaxID=2316722 RepID=UPI0011C45BCF|nr:hypothetical protein [Corallococcus aberystwythensis]
MTSKRVVLARVVTATITLSACGPALSTEETSSLAEGAAQAAPLEGLCHTSAYQPAGCSYGDYCQPVVGRCSVVPNPACDNFAIHGRAWDVNTSTGPVIYEATAIRFAPDLLFCGNPGLTRATFRIKAYAPTADLPTSRDGFHGRFYFVSPAGYEINATAIQNVSTTNENKHITFDVNLCVLSGATSYTAGFFFTGGSEVCVTAS